MGFIYTFWVFLSSTSSICTPGHLKIRGGGTLGTLVGIICPPGWDRVNFLAKTAPHDLRLPWYLRQNGNWTGNIQLFELSFEMSFLLQIEQLHLPPPLWTDLVIMFSCLSFFLGTHWFQKCNFWKNSLGPFWGRRGQTTSKSKKTKILNENLLKLDEVQKLASATSKMTSWPQWPRNRPSDFFQKLHFQNQGIKLRKMSYSSAF